MNGDHINSDVISSTNPISVHHWMSWNDGMKPTRLTKWVIPF